MLDDAIRTLYAYDRWATGRLFDAAARLPAEEFAPVAAPEGRSIRDTLVHMVAAQRRWLAWWDGSASPLDAQRLTLAPADFPDVASIRAAYGETAKRMRTYVEGLTDARLAETLSAGTWSAALWQLMLHVANHGTQHRSEVAAMLTAAGHSPGDIDMTVYYAATAP